MPMKILLIADEPDPMLWEHLDKRKLEGVQLILSCGDLSARYLSFLTCFTTAPIVYVPGNHDVSYEKLEPEGCLNADGQLLVINGVRILGLGGSMRYKPGPCMYTEYEMEKRIRKLKSAIRKHGGFDIMMTHSPMRGYGDMEDLPHQGFACFQPLLEQYKPRLFAFAHVHQEYNHRLERSFTFGETLAVNAYKSYTVEIDIPTQVKESRLELLRKRILQSPYLTRRNG